MAVSFELTVISTIIIGRYCGILNSSSSCSSCSSSDGGSDGGDGGSDGGDGGLTITPS